MGGGGGDFAAKGFNLASLVRNVSGWTAKCVEGTRLVQGELNLRLKDLGDFVVQTWFGGQKRCGRCRCILLYFGRGVRR